MSYHQRATAAGVFQRSEQVPVGQERNIQIEEAVLGVAPEADLQRCPVTLQARRPEAGEIVKSLGIKSEKFQTNEKLARLVCLSCGPVLSAVTHFNDGIIFLHGVQWTRLSPGTALK